jgi:hypothetical protein
LCSTQRIFERIEASPHRRTLLVASIAFVVGALLLKVVEKSAVELPWIGALTVPGIDKMTLGPLRLTHFLLSVVVIMQLLPRTGKALASLPARSVARIGRHSLECFCMSTVLVYLGCGLLLVTDSVTTANVTLSGIALVLLLCLFAALMDWIRSEPWRGERKRVPVTSAPQAPGELRGNALLMKPLPSRMG